MAATTSTADSKTSCEGPSAGADTGILKRGVGCGGSGIFFKMGGGGGGGGGGDSGQFGFNRNMQNLKKGG